MTDRFLQRHLHADDDGFLADIQMAEAADEAHAVELTGLLLEAANQQHVAIGLEFLFLGKLERRGCLDLRLNANRRLGPAGTLLRGCRHAVFLPVLSLRGHATRRAPRLLKEKLAWRRTLIHAQKRMDTMQLSH